jgi:hypothetical protein
MPISKNMHHGQFQQLMEKTPNSERFTTMEKLITRGITTSALLLCSAKFPLKFYKIARLYKELPLCQPVYRFHHLIEASQHRAHATQKAA